jgi:hypothetical protein
MRKLLIGCMAAIALLAIVSANLWLQLRAERQVTADLRAQMLQQDSVPPEPVQVQPLPATARVDEPTIAPAQMRDTSQVLPATPTPLPPVTAPPVLRVDRLPPTITEARREGAMAQSDQTATARVLAWKDRLAIAGHTLTNEQLQALNAAATAQMRRETEESLEIEITARPTDLESVIRMREETLNRQHQTNQRILAAVSPQLTDEQTRALRAQFDSGHAARMATFRAEQEMLRQQVQ